MLVERPTMTEFWKINQAIVTCICKYFITSIKNQMHRRSLQTGFQDSNTFKPFEPNKVGQWFGLD